LEAVKIYPSVVRSQSNKSTDVALTSFMFSEEKGIGLGGTKDYHGIFLDESFFS
jgi:hypothetical protein